MATDASLPGRIEQRAGWMLSASVVRARGAMVGGMRVVVDFDLCESNALCMAAAPEVFEVRDDDFLYVLQDNPPEELRSKVEVAVRNCPKQAIKLED
jgi:ferredoxin